MLVTGPVGLGLRAQTSPDAAAPLLAGAGSRDVAPGAAILTEASAQRALQLGLPSVAATLYAQLIAQPDLRPETQARLVLGWTIALLENDRVEEARAALAAYPGPRDAPFQLRVGLAAIAAGDAAEAREAIEGLEPEQLPPAERSWLFYLRGLIADQEGEITDANQAYAQAIASAQSSLQRARFALAQLRAQLRLGPVTEAQAATLAQNVERFQGRPVGYDYAKQYAAVLAALGRRGDAVTFLQRQLQALPAQERAVQDDLRLLLGLIAGAGEGIGRNALNNLLASGADPDKQRVALQLLAQALTGGAAREEWRAELGRLIAQEPPHPILAELLLYRAQLSLSENRWEEAEQDAQRLRELFPASPLQPMALGVLAGVAWERGRFRAAAGFATEARRLLQDGPMRAQLGVLVAEAFFRAADYRNAADAYGAALSDVPPGLRVGDLMFQQVMSQIRAGALDEAAARLDALAGNPDFDVVNRWQAEWNLARALQADDRNAEAAQRIDRLRAGLGAQGAPPPELAVRLAWLQARLALDAGQPERTLDLAPTLRARLEEVEPSLRADVGSYLALLEAQANFALGRNEAAFEILGRLRTTYPGTDAAVYSYIVEADAYTENNQLVDAQRLLTRLADDFPDDQHFAPYALYKAALNAERRGQDDYLEDAIRLIERLVNTYPKSDLVFWARFKQGDLLRKLNQFGSAVQIYEQLVNNYGQHHDVYAATLAQADCYAAQGAGDVSQLESAIAIYERLQVVPQAPVELRIEAGYKRGDALLRRGAVERAQATWWEVVNTFLIDAPTTAQLGARGPYWLARSLRDLARSLEASGKLDEARTAWELILQHNLPAPNLARTELARIVGPSAVEPGR